MRWGRQRFAASLLSGLLISGCAAPVYPEPEPAATNSEIAEIAPRVPTGLEIEEAFLRVALAKSAAEKASIYSQYDLDRDGFFELVEDHFETLEPYKWDLEEELWRTDRDNAARFFAKFGLLIQLWEGDPAPERKLEGEIYEIDDGTIGNTRLKAGSTVILRYYGSFPAAEDSPVEEAEAAAQNVSVPKCPLTPLNASDYTYEPLGEEALTPSGMSL